MALSPSSKRRKPASWQWQPTLTAHDPSPPITLEDGAGSGVTGTMNAALALSASISAAHGVSATLAGTLALSASIAATHNPPITGTMAAALALSEAIQASHGVSGTLGGTLALSAALSAAHGVSGTLAGTLGLSAALQAQHGVSGTLAGVLALSASLQAKHGVSATAAAALALSASLSASHGTSGTVAAALALSAALSGIAGTSVVPKVRLTARANRSAGPIPAIWRPSAMQGNATAIPLAEYTAIPGRHGLTRLASPFGAYDMSQATSLSDYVARCTTYLGLPEVREAISRGTCVLEINGTPKYLSSTSDTTVLPGSGWRAYRAAKPADLASNGAYYQAMNAFIDLVMNVFHYPAPRSAEGQLEIGRPGVILEFWNEPNFSFFFGYQGTGVLSDWLLAYRRFTEAARAANPLAVIGGPVVSGWDALRVDELYATDSADFFSFTGSPFTGGTEATGRRGGAATRSYFKFNPASLVPGAAIGGLNFVTSCAAVGGDPSADVFNINAYGTNGQTNPSAETGATRFNNCSSGTSYVASSTLWQTSGDNKTMDLGASARTQLAAARDAAATFSIGAWMTGEGGGASDHYANPRGFDNASVTLRPRLDVTYTKTFLELFCDYAAANNVKPDAIIIHDFEATPGGAAASAAALIASALANAGISQNTPYFITEYQNVDPAQVGVRDDYRSASYVLGTLYEHWQAGFSAMCQVLLKLTSQPAPSDPVLFTDEWGMITQGINNGAFVSVPSFMAMRLLSQWRDSGRRIQNDLSDSSYGVRRFTAGARDSLSVVAARWDPSGPSTVDLEVRAIGPARRIRYADVYRFTSTINNPVNTFNTTSGTYAVKVAAALAAGEAAVSERRTGSKFTVSLGQYDSLIAQFFYEPAVRLEYAEVEDAPTLEPEFRRLPEPEPKPQELPEILPEPEPELIPPVLGTFAASLQLGVFAQGEHVHPAVVVEQLRRELEELMILALVV